MRYPASEKLEIIHLVERPHLPIKQILDKLGIPRTTFYRWYDRYQIGGPEALEDQSPHPSRVWNRIPDDVRQRIVDLALDVPELSPRELAVRFTDTEKYFVSEASVYRLLKSLDLITSPAFIVIKAADEFRDKTTAINQLWQIKDAVSIRERPASVEDRAVPGHWEGDLIGCSKNSYIATLLERHSRYVMLAKVSNKDTQSVVSTLIKKSQKLPRELYKSLTWDRGKELSDHKRFTLATDIDVYFCDPQSPWQRGSNENTNRLLRQYFSKGTALSVHSQTYLNNMARQLNERPRKTLQFKTPADKFNQCVAMTG
jgi:IS30 family transposase